MNANIAALAYLASGVLFILTLRGLSSPVTSRRGNQMGMFGMAMAIAVTLATLAAQGLLDPVTIGLFTTAHNAGALSTATFDNVSVTSP